MERGKTARNVLIILVLAAIVWGLPGGALAGSTIANLLTVVLLAGMSFFAYRLYMEHRTTLFDLPDNHRIALYGCAALATITLVATGRMWDSGGPWILLWFALVLGAAYGIYSVIRAQREY